MAGRIVHFEVPYDDADRARDFYSSLFGWQLQWLPEMDYTMVATGPMSEQGMPTEPGFINGGMAKREGPVEHPVVVIDVDDIDATLKAVGDKGGSTLMERQPVGDMGFTAYFRDCEGNVMGLWQNAAPQPSEGQQRGQGAGGEPDYAV